MVLGKFVVINDEVMRNSRLVLCPDCDHEMRADCEEEEVICGGCGSSIEIGHEGMYPEEFVWHPKKKY